MQDGNEGPRKRGRPRKFVENDVLEKVARLFLYDSFAGAALDDLAQAAGLNRPSLAGAFGDKAQLFVRAMDRVGARERDFLLATLSRRGPIEERLTEFLMAAVADRCASAGGFSAIAAAAAPANPEIAEAALAQRAGVQAALEEAFGLCLSRRELPEEPTPQARAQMTMAVLDTLALRARYGEKAQSLETFVRDSIAIICFV
ncbi:MAG: TetR/AcrR family transcriptional regulator [Hyphomicrobiales bacterium]|nr:TetR/AcrR family transcriptional regulator [Hyphomicrobiales bacterium]